MSIELAKLRQVSQELIRADPFLNWRARDIELHHRSLDVKHDWQLKWLETFYPAKIERLLRHYDEMSRGLLGIPADQLEEALSGIEAKIRRLSEKLRATKFEILGRKEHQLTRNPIGTTYYIDFTNGNDENDGLGTDTAWKTLEKYTTVTARTPGDIAKIRAATTEIPAANVAFDEDGTLLNPIKIKGCSISDDPWGDESDVRPIVDFNSKAYCMYFSGDEGWDVEHLDVKGSKKNSYDAAGNISLANTVAWHGKDLRLYDSTHSGLSTYRTSFAILEDSELFNNTSSGLYIDAFGTPQILRCKFNGGANQDVGIALYGAAVYCEECEFGQTTPHITSDIGGASGEAVFKACKFNKFNFYSDINLPSNSAFVFWEDCTGTPSLCGAKLLEYFFVLKDTATLPQGKTGYSLKMYWKIGDWSYYAGLGIRPGLSLANPNHYYPIRLWKAAGSYTIKIKVRATEAWTTYPTADELYLAARYYDEANTYSVATAKSTQTISDGSTWVDFQVSITTGREGPIYLDVILDKYETGNKGVYVYPVPDVS